MRFINIPTNPMMLLSFTNTKLRDEYKDLDEFCYDLMLEKSEIIEKLEMIDYHYDEKLNRFI